MVKDYRTNEELKHEKDNKIRKNQFATCLNHVNSNKFYIGWKGRIRKSLRRRRSRWN